MATKRNLDATGQKSPAETASTPRAKMPARKRPRLHQRPTVSLSQLDPSPASSSLFFQLPRELRDQVYHEVWTTTPHLRQRYLRKFYSVTYGHRKPSAQPVNTAAWLLASKQILLEGLAQFHRQSVWHFVDTDAENRPSEYVFPLLTPGLVYAQHLHLEHWTPLDRKDGTFTLRKESVALVNRMVSSMHEDDALKEIRVSILWGAVDPAILASACQFDLSKLERLGVQRGVEEFGFHVAVEGLAWGGVPAARRRVQLAETQFGDALKSEAERVGRALVPDGVESQALDTHREVGSGNSGLLWSWAYEVKKG
ncbi:hypothetical protein BU26DRAFT_562779 [Trematosphaeria pertusa]|uniref:Uncharacterized protein n=1 Tax=Trematosphaeria pertusa TaxID=390896 RepID=A0A6A6IMV8_9PLEO|nr:uncharacterized protein BU26DRAFT_562779 [Trematosphaeria pertusa]KAF2250813.1 hypothetical protein BU26DRAFT_562779 [Trematosphaeria pertusa]